MWDPEGDARLEELYYHLLDMRETYPQEVMDETRQNYHPNPLFQQDMDQLYPPDVLSAAMRYGAEHASRKWLRAD